MSSAEPVGRDASSKLALRKCSADTAVKGSQDAGQGGGYGGRLVLAPRDDHDDDVDDDGKGDGDDDEDVRGEDVDEEAIRSVSVLTRQPSLVLTRDPRAARNGAP